MSELLEQLRKLKAHKKSKSYYADKLGVSELEVEALMQELRGKSEPSSITVLEDMEEDYYTEYNVEKGTVKSQVVSNFEPKTPEELASLHKVDLTKYKISSYWTKQKGDKFTSSLLCTLIKPAEFDPEKFGEFIKSYKSTFVPLSRNKKEQVETVDVEISIADFHLDKLTFDRDGITDRAKMFENIAHKLISKVDDSYTINKIVFVIGNDYFHTDNYLNSTTNLTPQDIAVPFNEAYEIGYELLVNTISNLRSFCKQMEIILVQGNHDRTKSYYLAHALEVFFKADKFISFKREHSTTKHIVLGNTFIGYHHGNTKIDDLPLLFATSTESSKAFGNAKYREIHVGDKHYYMAKEIKGVRVAQLPSLSGVDRWHLDNNYVNNIRAAIASIYHTEKGKIGELEERI